MSGLEQGEGTAGQLLRDRQLYENMNGAVGELRQLLARHPRRSAQVPERPRQPVLTVRIDRRTVR